MLKKLQAHGGVSNRQSGSQFWVRSGPFLIKETDMVPIQT
jgi:hypothetical protein